MSETTRNVLVTGGAGFIGSHLVLALLDQGHTVTVIDDMSNGLQSNLDLFKDKITFIKASITDQKALTDAANGKDTIFHLAAVSNVAQTLDHPVEAHQVNTTGTLNVFEAARANNAHVVYSSSAAVFGPSAELPKTEGSQTNPISLYGSQKLFGEHYLKNYCQIFNISGVALRYFNVYGPRQRPDSPYSGVISVFVDRALKDEPISIHGDGQQTRDFIHVSDVVNANLIAMEARHNKGDHYCVCTTSEITVKSLAEQIVQITDSNSKISRTDARPGDIKNSIGNCNMLRTRLGFDHHTAFKDGLKDLIEHTKQANL